MQFSLSRSFTPWAIALALVAVSTAAAPRARATAPLDDRPESDKDDKAVAKELLHPGTREKERRFYMAVGIGTDFDTGATRFSRGATGPVFPVSQVISEGTMTFSGPPRFRTQHYSDVYPYRFATAFYRPQIELGFALNRNLEVFGTFAHTRADSRPLTVGQAAETTVTTTFNPFTQVTGPTRQVPINAEFGDYRAYGGELGLRWLLPRPAAWVNGSLARRLRPYLSLSGGATYVESIRQRTSGALISGGNAYEGSWVGTGALLAGLEVTFTPTFSVTLDAGVRYASTLSREAPSGAAGLQQVSERFQDAGDRLFCPLTLMAKLRF